MSHATTAVGRYQQLDGKRRGLLQRYELYSAYTLPKICPEDNYHQNSEQLNQDFQAVGAQATNHLCNKLMLSTFAPGNTFFRLDATRKAEEQMAAVNATPADIAASLAQAELAASAQLDKLALRPKLYEAFKHLIITGNVLVCMSDDEPFRVIGIKHYVVRRSLSGKIIEIIIKDDVLRDELDPKVQEYVSDRYKENRKVCLYRWFKRNSNGDFEMSQWVDQTRLPKNFDGKWPEDKMPYRVLTWDLADKQDYGTGLVEDYANDFAGLSALSKAQVQGAILASEFRWLVNPAGMTRVEDFEETPNGGAMPGTEGDIVLISNSKASDLQVTLNMSSEYVNRIGRAFLLGSMLVRQAERVTAEEIRMTANELETALGGAYSRLAVEFQGPMARWLLEKIQVNIADNFEITVITGLDALSRTRDLEELKLFLADLAAVATLPEAAMAEISFPRLMQKLAEPRRIDVSYILKTPEEKQADRDRAMEEQATMMAAQSGADIATAAGSAQGEQ